MFPFRSVFLTLLFLSFSLGLHAGPPAPIGLKHEVGAIDFRKGALRERDSTAAASPAAPAPLPVGGWRLEPVLLEHLEGADPAQKREILRSLSRFPQPGARTSLLAVAQQPMTAPEAIVSPRQTVREGSRQTRLELRDGETVSGILKSESATGLTILDAEGRVRAVANSSVRERQTSDISLMPEGLQTGLSLDAWNDLLAYLESLK